MTNGKDVAVTVRRHDGEPAPESVTKISVSMISETARGVREMAATSCSRLPVRLSTDPLDMSCR